MSQAAHRTGVLFTGDSITDCDRRADPDHLGFGYVRLLNEALELAAKDVVNTGIGGNRVCDLEQRWDHDVVDHHPGLLSILIGVNDMWHRFSRNDPTSTAAFRAGYRRILERLPAEATSVVLIEPFLLPVRPEQDAWLNDLAPKAAAVRELAEVFGAIFVPAQSYLDSQAQQHGAAAIAYDGVHPTPLGHRLLADLWIQTVFTTASPPGAVGLGGRR
ncbi:SGNH/GDSL hydrolase family protein [Glaciibacter superstes]|uniref:SGNH/GDSL hydrolase family protein n=1 Tax=Glaciibacter superstes TaxID=501023 RepID=UPI0003B3AA34|nr:SGNH/GDSL hydrolase family protein [Glaciibacter superstes]